ncbi:hypothetical protein AUR04nite_28680 [Glutamicibacter uratoxydans]|uniref:Uncharacterized protein n=1 Tax=Glutamicibacter uratoxydans TaxID=43667 RepID=A0A4Y4DQW9_GLUUR|nr:hypothetical protein [Glutamicibacter uratoxydans]GED07336.1 hypothetical protein AUR04nite_28680 [Glutamicibacter uratoxydans]
MSNTSGGKPSARVYRRRRITVAVAALVLIGLIVWGITVLVGMFTSSDAPSPDAAAPSVQSSPSAGSGEEAQTASANACKEGEVKITASTDKKSYAPEENPVLTLGIENTSDRECEVNVGTSQQEFLISSGSDRIFSTVDCLANSEDVLLKFAAGQKENAKFDWNRNRSAPGCKAVNAQPLPGTYKFTAALGELTSDPVTFVLK